MQVCEACVRVVAVVVKDCWLGTSMTKMIQPPTARLPPIARIATFTTTQLFESVQYLQKFYQPQVRGSQARRRRQDDDDEAIWSDAFERAYYADRWLTALIAQLEARTSSDDTDTLIQQAASLLATCAGVVAAGKVQHRFAFESALVRKIHVDLTDIAQTWGGAYVLAEVIAKYPSRFGLSAHDQRPLCILELGAGAGTGLVGLTVAKLWHALPLCNPNQTFLPRASNIVLTDFYPATLDNLPSNIHVNFPTLPDDRLPPDPHQQASFGLVLVLSNRRYRIFCRPHLMSSLAQTLFTRLNMLFGYSIVLSLSSHIPMIRTRIPYFTSWSLCGRRTRSSPARSKACLAQKIVSWGVTTRAYHSLEGIYYM